MSSADDAGAGVGAGGAGGAGMATAPTMASPPLVVPTPPQPLHSSSAVALPVSTAAQPASSAALTTFVTTDVLQNQFGAAASDIAMMANTLMKTVAERGKALKDAQNARIDAETASAVYKMGCVFASGEAAAIQRSTEATQKRHEIEKSAHEGAMQALKRKYDDTEKDCDTTKQELREARAKVAQKEGEVERLCALNASLKEGLETVKTRYNADYAELEERMKKREEYREMANREFYEAKEGRFKLKAQIAETKSEGERAKLNQKLTDVSEEFLAKHAAHKAELAKMLKDQEALKDQMATKHKIADDLRTKLDEAGVAQRTAKQEALEMQAQLKRERGANADLETANQSAQQQIKELEERLRAMREEASISKKTKIDLETRDGELEVARQLLTQVQRSNSQLQRQMNNLA